MGEIKQNRQEVASRPIRQLSDELGGQHPMKHVNLTAHLSRLKIVISLSIGEMRELR